MIPVPTLIWAYTYRISPPQAPGRLRRLRALLLEEHAILAAEHDMWEGRLVVEDRVAHILVLSSSPDLTRAVNERIEAELSRMGAVFTVTVPLAIPPDVS
jgi:hypothetical protein